MCKVDFLKRIKALVKETVSNRTIDHVLIKALFHPPPQVAAAKYPDSG